MNELKIANTENKTMENMTINKRNVMKQMRIWSTEMMKKVRRSMRFLWSTHTGKATAGARLLEEQATQPGAEPTERPPAPVAWPDWCERLREFPGDTHHSLTTRGCMRSGARMWVRHACAHGLDPAREDWGAVDEMFAASTLARNTQNTYRSHIRSWFRTALNDAA